MGHRISFLSAVLILLSFVWLAQAEPAWIAPGGQEIREDDLVLRYETADAHFFRAEDSFLKMDYLTARAELAECLKLMPEHSEAHYLLAQINVLQGFFIRALNHVIKAEDYYDFAVKIRGEQQQRLLVELQRMRDEQESILADLEKVLAHTSDNPTRMSLEARILQARKIKTSIEDRLLSPRSPLPEGPAEYHEFHGEILLHLKRYPEAETQFRMAMRLAPTEPEAYENLAGMLLLTGHARIALDVIDEAEARGLEMDEKLKQDVLKALGKMSGPPAAPIF